MLWINKGFTITVLVILATNGWSDLPPVEYFAKPPEYYNAILSPDGKHIAVERAADEDKVLVAVVRTKDLKLVSHIPAGKIFSPISPFWVNNEHIVVEHIRSRKGREYETLWGTLTSMSVKSGKKTRILARNSPVDFRNRNANDLYGFGRVVHRLPKEKDFVLVRFNDWTDTNGKYGVKPKLLKLHLRSGKAKYVTQALSYRAEFVFSADGEPLFSFGVNEDEVKSKNHWVSHRYDNGVWTPLKVPSIDAKEIEVVGLSENSDEIILLTRYQYSPDKLYRYNLQTGERALIFSHQKVDPESFDKDRKTDRLVAIHYEWKFPDIHIVDTDHIYSRWYPSLYNAFPGKRVRITSATDDGDKLVVHISGANEPGQFYLFDTQKKKMRYLFNARSWLDADTLAQTYPFSFEARDGLELQGYLTLPNDDSQDSPLVVMPHHGPHGVRDWWSYDPEVQFLASRGYSVLKINYRGSEGFGLGFEESGYRKWGTDIQHDIIDATRWLIEQGGIDGERVCILGGAFGGYSALMSSIIAPDLFKCAVSVSGFYDLELMWKTNQNKRSQHNKNYLKLAIGKDKAEMREFSPYLRVDNLNAPVMLVHGKKDWRAHIKHFYVMKQALDKKRHPLETILYDQEGHGISSEENRIRYLRRVEAFLEKHIGSTQHTSR